MHADVNQDFFRNFLTETSGFCEWQRASNYIFYTPSVARMIPFSVHSTGATAELSFLFWCSQPIQNRCFLQSKEKAKIFLTQHRLLKCESIPQVDITIPSLALTQIDDEESENQVCCRQTCLLWVQGHLAAVALLFPLE